MIIKASLKSNRLVPVTACVVGVPEGEKNLLAASCLITGADRSKVQKELTDKKFKGKTGELLTLASHSPAQDFVLVVGLGKLEKLSFESVRRAASVVYQKATREKWSSLRVDFETFAVKSDRTYALQSMAEGFLLAGYRFIAYKSKKNDHSVVETVELVHISKDAAKAMDAALDRASVIAEAVCLARDLGNEPPNVLYPESYAARLKKVFGTQSGVKFTVFDEKRLKTLKMGGILGVGQGSIRKPRLTIAEYKPARARNKKPIVFVGKGVTFDTGGISIKPSNKMEEMKFDMCGSAAVMSAVYAASRLKLPLHVIAIAPMAENMPGGGAQRPGDTITCYNGKTVDVLNTDAEGRLILADALAYAKNFSPECIVDIATLTGACAHTLDYVASGVMGIDAKLVNRLKEAGEATGERLWEFPLWEEYEDFIRGAYGDIQNISNKTAGIITSGLFLKNFADHSPWAHLDVAGTAWSTSTRHYNPAGATGVGVRLFVKFLESYLG